MQEKEGGIKEGRKIRIEKKRFELLAIPKDEIKNGGDFNKGLSSNYLSSFDFGTVRKKPFSFSGDQVGSEIEDDEKPDEIDTLAVPEKFNDIKEPKEGLYPEGFEPTHLESARERIPYVSFVPHLISNKDKFLSFSGREFPKNARTPSESLLGDPRLMTKVDDKTKITLIDFRDIKLPNKVLKNLPKWICVFVNLEVLVLRNIGLKKIGDFASAAAAVSHSVDDPSNPLRSLRYCDFTHNDIRDVKQICKMVRAAPYVEEILMVKNPVCNKPRYRESIIGCNPSLTLRAIDGKAVNSDERIRSLGWIISRPSASSSSSSSSPSSVGGTGLNVSLKKGVRWEDVAPIVWDIRFSDLSQIQGMISSKWDPEGITRLDLSGCGLGVFHIGGFPNLQWFDVSDNALASIRGQGLEKCRYINYLNLRNNCLGKKDLQALAFCTRLRCLYLKGNKLLGNNYTPLVIWITRNSKGDNRCVGLHMLDGSVVTIEKRIQALGYFHKKATTETLPSSSSKEKKKMDKKLYDSDNMRWKFNLIAYFGHKQMATKGYLASVTHLKLPRARLRAVNLSQLSSLEGLDFSGNGLLRTIGGLDSLSRLRILNLFNVPKIDLKETLPKLGKVNSLHAVWFGVDAPQSHKRHFSKLQFRIKVLTSLLFNNPNLRFLDGKSITQQERVETYKRLGASEEQAETYRFQLALNCNATLPWNRRYHFTEVEIGNQYDPSQITVLRRLCSLSLSKCLSLSPSFVNLEELNISRNKLTRLTPLGLSGLPNLMILDASSNCLDYPHPLTALAAELDTLKRLEILALRDNPCMKSQSDRTNLLGLMKITREVTCRLQVLDIRITLDERVDAWKKAGGTHEEAELMRFQTIMFLRTPHPENIQTKQPLDPSALKKIVHLDLSSGGLSKLDLAYCPNLKTLLLKDNKLKSVWDLGGLREGKISKLECLDLRKNFLSKYDEITELVVEKSGGKAILPELQNIGLAGNRWSDKNWRVKLIASMPQLREFPISLKAIDNVEIGCLEIVSSWKVSGHSSHDRIRLQVLHLLQFPRTGSGSKLSIVDPSKVTNLDFSSSELTLMDVDMSAYPNLVALNLRNNQIANKGIEKSNLHSLSKLKELDIAQNKIKDMRLVSDLVEKLPKLECFWVEGNPCWESKRKVPLVVEALNFRTRVKFISDVRRLHDPHSCTHYLNGFEITIRERTTALQEKKVYDDQGIEKLRMDLLWERDQPKSGSQLLDASNLGIRSLSEITTRISTFFPYLTSLNLSDNCISSSQELQSLLRVTPHLEFINLRNNLVDCDYKHLFRLIGAASLVRLRDIMVLRAPKKEAAKKSSEPSHTKKTERQAFKDLPSLATLDNSKNPNPPPPLPPLVVQSTEDDGDSGEERRNRSSDEESGKPKKRKKPKKQQDWDSSDDDDQPPSFFGLDIEDSEDGSGSESGGDSDANDSDDDDPMSRWKDDGGDYNMMGLGADFNADSYLPKDYHKTIGRNYDLGMLAANLAKEAAKRDEGKTEERIQEPEESEGESEESGDELMIPRFESSDEDDFSSEDSAFDDSDDDSDAPPGYDSLDL